MRRTGLAPNDGYAADRQRRHANRYRNFFYPPLIADVRRLDMRRRLLLILIVSLPLAGAANMSQEALSNRLYERLGLEKVAEGIFQPMLSNSQILASDPSLPGKLSSTFRSALTSAMAESFSNEQLSTFLAGVERGEDVSVEFVDWLNRSVVDGIQAASDAHINNRFSPGDFRIDSMSSGRSRDK